MQKTVLILGATSKICHEAARVWAKKNYNFVLVGRKTEKLEGVKRDLVAFGADAIDILTIDLANTAEVEDLVDQITSKHPKIDLILIGQGAMHDQNLAKYNTEMVETEITTNYLSSAIFLTKIRPWLEEKPGTRIGVITSVAGDRGRQSNYVYGSSKAGISAFVEGFRADMASKHVFVTNIKPGPVLTPMTAHLKASGANLASAAEVGLDIMKAMEGGKRSLYTPFKWLFIMLIIRNIPSFIFDKLKI